MSLSEKISQMSTFDIVAAIVVICFFLFLAFVVFGLIYTILSVYIFDPIRNNKRKHHFLQTRDVADFLNCTRPIYKFLSDKLLKENASLSVSYKSYNTHELAHVTIDITLSPSKFPYIKNYSRSYSGGHCLDMFYHERAEYDKLWTKGHDQSISEEERQRYDMLAKAEEESLYRKYDEIFTYTLFGMSPEQFGIEFSALCQNPHISAYREKHDPNSHFLNWKPDKSLYRFLELSDLLENGDIKASFFFPLPKSFFYRQKYATNGPATKNSVVINVVDDEAMKEIIKRIKEI